MPVGLAEKPSVGSLSNVRVSKQFLLESLYKNRNEHQHDYETLIAQYRELLDHYAKSVRKIVSRTPENEIPDISELEFPPRPKNFLNRYDETIAMIEASLDDEFILEQSEFNAFVRNNWNWANEFNNTKMIYRSSLNKI